MCSLLTGPLLTTLVMEQKNFDFSLTNIPGKERYLKAMIGNSFYGF